MLWFIR